MIANRDPIGSMAVPRTAGDGAIRSLADAAAKVL
jgi:hypothetical protein